MDESSSESNPSQGKVEPPKVPAGRIEPIAPLIEKLRQQENKEKDSPKKDDKPTI